MTRNLSPRPKILVGVAPVSMGAHALNNALEAASKLARLTPSGAPHILGQSGGWVAIERNVSLTDTTIGVRETLEQNMPAGVDVALLDTTNRRKRLLVSDMDSTMIEQECLDELAGYAGIKDEIAAITARAMAGDLDFEGALTERVARLNGLSLDALSQCYEERITIMPGARALVATMARHGAHCLLVSGGFTYFTSRVAETIGFHADQGNRLLDDGTRLTGAVGQPILGREAKRDALVNTARKQGLGPEDCLAMGDGANDLAMIMAAGLGLAVHAKPVVAEASDAAIRHTDLTAALYFQGYTDDEIVWD